MNDVIVPDITTERLLLRRFRQTDLEFYYAMMNDAAVAAYLGNGEVPSRAWIENDLVMMDNYWKNNGFGLWAVEERTTNKFVGRIGCFEPKGFGAIEIAYALARHSWRKGYAIEGARAALNYARTTLRRTEILSIIRCGNERSVAVARVLGAVLDRTIESTAGPLLVYRYSNCRIDECDSQGSEVFPPDAPMSNA